MGAIFKMIFDGVTAAVEAYSDSEDRALEVLERTIAATKEKLSEMRAKIAANREEANKALEEKFKNGGGQ